MPKLMGQSDTAVHKTVSNFGFSATRPDALGASEYTLVDISIDASGSVSPHKADLEKMYREIIGSCRLNPRAENILIRCSVFNDNLKEIHGFISLDNIDESKVSFSPQGSTALYDTVLSSIEALSQYAKTLTDMDYFVNAVFFTVTDGEENASKIASEAKIKTSLDKARTGENLESIKSILIGVGDQGAVQVYLDAFNQNAGFDQFVWVGSADAKSLAKLGGFISKSISSSSQALGTGGPSQNLTI